ncbi:MAG: serine acetyltransferase [Lachnospiraceae bacterium]|nr:serine acetyltransferase [Lachnospiraceae bacterium]
MTGINENSDNIKNVVDEILKDYELNRDIDKMSVFHQPDKEAVTSIVNKMLRIIYPGYYRDKLMRSYNIKSNLNVWIEDVIYNLSKQVALVLQYQNENGTDNGCGCEDDLEKEALCISIKFCEQIPKMREYLDTDLEATLQGDPAALNKDEIILSYPGLLATTINRMAHELFLLNVPLIPRMMTEYAHSITGIDIHPAATIGKYFFIDHGTGIVVGSTTIIGDNVKIYQGVTIGALSTSGGQSLRGIKRHPTIEDNVTIYSGASILGGETVIGHDSVIGSNAFITKSIPANARVTLKNQELVMKTSNEKDFASVNNKDGGSTTDLCDLK